MASQVWSLPGKRTVTLQSMRGPVTLDLAEYPNPTDPVSDDPRFSAKVTPEFKEAMRKELGDVLWYLAETAGYLGVNLSEVAAGNLLKVLDRKARGTLGGSGDNR